MSCCARHYFSANALTRQHRRRLHNGSQAHDARAGDIAAAIATAEESVFAQLASRSIPCTALKRSGVFSGVQSMRSVHGLCSFFL